MRHQQHGGSMPALQLAWWEVSHGGRHGGRHGDRHGDRRGHHPAPGTGCASGASGLEKGCGACSSNA